MQQPKSMILALLMQRCGDHLHVIHSLDGAVVYNHLLTLFI